MLPCQRDIDMKLKGKTKLMCPNVPIVVNLISIN
jgi:hypothetical protein